MIKRSIYLYLALVNFNLLAGECPGTTNQKFIINLKAMVLYEGAEMGSQLTRSEYYLHQSQLIVKQKTKMRGIPLLSVNFVCEKNE